MTALLVAVLVVLVAIRQVRRVNARMRVRLERDVARYMWQQRAIEAAKTRNRRTIQPKVNDFPRRSQA